MRNFQTLDTVTVDASTGIITLDAQQGTDIHPVLALRREGDYVAVSASYGPLEIALRPRFQELSWTLGRLQPTDGLQTSLQVGTVQAYLAVGLRSDGTLLVRPTIVGDATGHIHLNLALTPDARKKLFDWLEVGKSGPPKSSLI